MHYFYCNGVVLRRGHVLGIADISIQDVVRHTGENCRVYWGHDLGFVVIRARQLPFAQHNDLRPDFTLLLAFLDVISVLVPVLWSCYVVKSFLFKAILDYRRISAMMRCLFFPRFPWFV